MTRQPRPATNIINLPATIAEAERLEFAREFARRLYAAGDLDTEGNRAFVRDFLSIFLLTAEGRMSLCAWARIGEEEAKAILNAAILELQSRDEKLPTELANYNMQLVNGEIPSKPSWGGPRIKNELLRNICICLMVAADVGRFHSKPTGHSARRRSGCSIVAEALGAVDETMTYEAVEAKWKKFGKYMPGPDWSGWKFSF